MATNHELKLKFEELVEGDAWEALLDEDLDEIQTAPETANIFDDLDFIVAEDLKAARDLRDQLKSIHQTAEKIKEDGEEANWYPTKKQHEDVVAPAINSFLQAIKVVLENKFVDMNQEEVEKYFPQVSDIPILGGFWNWIQDSTPPPNLSEILQNVMESSLEYLSLHPGYSISLKKDIRATPDTSALGPAPIFSDLAKEALAPSEADHYIGLVLDAKKSNGKRSSPYIPLRTSPFHDKEPLKLGWEDQGYSFLNNGGDLVKREHDHGDGVEVPLGTGVVVTEIVESATGTWVGIIFSDQRISSGKIEDLTSDGKRPLYTRVEYVRKKEEKIVSSPDPYTSRKLVAHEVSEPYVNLPDGVKLISPDSNLNWTKLEPKDVRLAYFNFNKFNKKDMGDKLVYNLSSLLSKPTTRYSEGYYYFIAGEGRRLTTEQLVEGFLLGPNEYPEPDPITGDDSKEVKDEKNKESAKTTAEIKEQAWNDLLRYMNKDMGQINSNLYNMLRADHFVPVAVKVATKSSNPKNQKVLFAIAASYIDALPDSIRPYSRDFDSESLFYNGKNFAFTLPLKEVKKRSQELATLFKKKIKPKVSEFKDTGGLIFNPYNLDYNIDIQIKAFEDFPDLLDGFLKRQTFPASSNSDNISELCSEGIRTTKDHMIQIGLKDNNVVGWDARETISYVLFSPDPESLKESHNSNLNLFEFDPYLTDDELSGNTSIKRSAIPLRIGLNWFREEFPGVIGSRTLHYLMAYKNLITFSDKGTRNFKSEDWIKFLQSHSVPPFEISLSRNRTLVVGKLECKELIRRLRRSGPNSGLEQQKLQELLYRREDCMKEWQREWSDATPATDPESSKAALRKKQQETQKASENSGALEDFKLFYRSFLNNLDPQALMALLMACLQHKLGIPITAEALCEAAIIEVIERIGIENVKKTIIQNIPELAPYLGDTSGYLGDEVTGIIENLEKNDATETEEVEDKLIDMDGQKLNPKFRNAPIAAAFALTGADPVIVNILLNMEKGGTIIELVPGPRPTGENSIEVPYGTGILPDELNIGGSTYTISTPNYTWDEVDSEKARLMNAGYSEKEAKALLIQSGYLIPRETQYSGLLSSGGFESTLDKLESDLAAFGDVPIYGMNVSGNSINAAVQDAKAWVQWLKTLVDIGALCEAVVGKLLEIPGLLFTEDPGGGLSDWGEDFWQGLKRRYSLPVPTMRFPFSLKTDNHMGDYSERLWETILGLAGMILGQVLNLILEDALNKCYGEEDDMGSATTPALASPPPDLSIPLPSLPTIPGLEPSYILAWMKDILSRLPAAQICDLLYGDPSRRLLNKCLEMTKQDWNSVYEKGINTRFEIQNIFFQIGKELDLDICDAIQATAPIITDACGATFDFDARCEELKLHGLTEEECTEQINRELEDLKNRVMAMTELMFPGANPFRNAFPDPCSPGGGFVMPPGVQDTMSRITENMLTNVQGSLLQDMSTMKFLTIPPRAVQVATNPKELKAAHDMFAKAVKNNNEVTCLAAVADTGVWYGDLMATSVFTYNLVYGRNLHCDMTIQPGDAKVMVGDKELKQLIQAGVGLDTIGQYSDLYSDLKTVIPSPNSSHMRLAHRASYDYYGTDNHWDEIYSEDTTFQPVTTHHICFHPLDVSVEYILALILDVPEFPNTPDGYAVLKELEKIADTIWTEAGKPEILGSQTERIVKILSSYSSEQDLGERIAKLFRQQTVPMGLENLVYSPRYFKNEDLQRPNLWGGFAAPGSIPHPQGGAGIINTDTGEYIVDTGWFPGSLSGKSHLSSVVPLDKTLKEAFNANGTNLRQFTQLIRAYTGLLDIKKHKDFLPSALKEYSLEAYTRIEELMDINSFSGANAVFKAFETMTVGEAIGLTGERLEALYPEMSAGVLGTIEGVIFTEGFLEIDGLIIETKDKHADPGSEQDDEGQFLGTYDVVETTTGKGWSEVDGGSDPYGDGLGTWGPIPLYIVFKKQFRDPDSVLNSDPQELLNYFSMEDKKVSPELHEALSAGPHLNRVEPSAPLYTDDIAGANLSGDDASFLAARDIESNINFNPNILLYDLPFTQFVTDNPAGQQAQEASEKMIELFNNLSTSDDKVQEITNQLSVVNKQSSITLQHVITPCDTSHIFTQEINPENPSHSGVKDAFKLVKGKLTPLYPSDQSISPSPDGPPAIITDPSHVDVSKLDHYEIDVSKKLDPSVQNLLYDIFPEIYNIDPSLITSAGASSTRLINEWKSMAKAVSAPGSELAGQLVKDPAQMMKEIGADDKYAASSYVHGGSVDPITGELTLYPPLDPSLSNYKVDPSPYILNPLNFKGTIFGKLLVHKLRTFYDQYGGSFGNKDIFWQKLQYILSSYGFSALQFAYSNQMFLKLKHSRLNSRKFMRKLWKKILRTPGSAVDPRCQDVFDQLGVTSSKDLEEAETDFFNLSEVKPRILNFYKKSICRSVHEQDTEDTPYKDLTSNAVRSTLIEGSVILLIKAHVLEACIASVVAWDSFEISDVFKDDAMVQVIINNMRQSTNAEDEDLLAFFANNILRAQENLTDVEGYLALSEFSSLEYLIKKEGENAAKIINSMFTNNKQLSTDLTLDILRTSDADFPERFRKLRGLDETAQLPHKLSSLHTEAGYDYVVDAKFTQNIYTMNYGSGKQTTIKDFDESALVTSHVSFLYGFPETIASTLQGSYYNVLSDIELFDSSAGSLLDGRVQRNYFHSLPLTNIAAVTSHGLWGHPGKEGIPFQVSNGPYRTGYYAYEAGDLSEVEGTEQDEVLKWGQAVNKDIVDQWYNSEAAWKRYESHRLTWAGPQIIGQFSAHFPTQDNYPVNWLPYPSPGDVPQGDILEKSFSDEYLDQGFDAAPAPHMMSWLHVQEQLLEGAEPWRNENTYEATHGNNINAKFGNITFQPFVKIVDATAEDNKNLEIEEYSYTDQEGNPCEIPTLILKEDVNDILTYPFFKEYREKHNIFRAHIGGYVPLSIWSSFYTNVFVRYLEINKKAKSIFQKYGLKPFFKEIKVGIRLSYSTSFPVTEAGHFAWDDSKSMEAFYKSIPEQSLLESKTFFNDRPYIIGGPTNDAGLHQGAQGEGYKDSAQAKGSMLRELMIPVKEVAYNLNLLPGGFDIGGDLISYDELGYYPAKFTEDLDYIVNLEQEEDVLAALANPEETKFLLNTWHQFFYKNVAQDLVDDMKNSPEFKLLFDYLFPMRRYMALAAIYGAEGLSKFISKPTNVLEETKETIIGTLKGIISSGDYTFVPDEVVNSLVGLTTETGTRPNNPDLTGKILQIVLETPLLILKGFVEVTDPAIIIAKAIIDIANMVQQAVIGAVKQALQTVKTTLQTAISQAESALSKVEASVATAATVGEALAQPIPENLRPKINKNNGLETWTVEVPELPEGAEDQLEQEGLLTAYQQSKEKFEELDKLLVDYKTLKNKIGQPGGECSDGEETQTTPGSGLKGEMKAVECDLEKVVKESEELMKDLFASPFLLPSVWAALVPSQVPYGGGITPFPIGPPSTFPGMIYLAILFIDAFEEKMHDEVTKTKGANCEEEL